MAGEVNQRNIPQTRVQLGMLLRCLEVTFPHYKVIKINLHCALAPHWWAIRENSGKEHL